MESDGISMIKKWLYIILILGIFGAGCTHKEQPKVSCFEKIIKQKKIKVAILNNSTSYFLYRGTPMGFHYELMSAYAKHLGVTIDLDIVPDYETALKKIENGECDVLASSVSITGSRKKKMLFTTPIFRSNPVLVQNKNSTFQYIDNWLDVGKLDIAINSTGAAKRTVENLQEYLGIEIDVIVVPDADQEELIDQVAEDLLPATLADKIIAKASQTYYPDLDISVSAGLTRNIAWAVHLNSLDLVENINTWLDEYRKTTTYKTLYVKYFRNEKSIQRNKTGYELSAKQLSIYDTIIKQEAQKIGWDWRLFSALVYAESRFDPKQVSWAGACGVMQLMPSTAKRFGASRNSPIDKQIAAGGQVLQFLENQFAQTMQDKTDLKLFVLAAYNSGAGHIFDARNLAEKYGKNKDKWADVAPYLLLLRQPKYYKDEVVKHGFFKGKETVNHVEKIMNVYEHYKGLFEQ